MYTPKHFQEDESQTALAVIRQKVLGTLVVSGDDTLCANHLPFIALEDNGRLARLQAHIPRANPLNENVPTACRCVVIFELADGYISPSWYATKNEHGKVVPTWNYAVIHVHGSIRIVDNSEWVFKQLNSLTDHNEQHLPHPWSVNDAPRHFIDQLVRSLVGVEVEVKRIEGKFKCSQNQPQANKQSLLDAIHQEQIAPALGSVMKPRITS